MSLTLANFHLEMLFDEWAGGGDSDALGFHLWGVGVASTERRHISGILNKLFAFF